MNRVLPGRLILLIKETVENVDYWREPVGLFSSIEKVLEAALEARGEHLKRSPEQGLNFWIWCCEPDGPLLHPDFDMGPEDLDGEPLRELQDRLDSEEFRVKDSVTMLVEGLMDRNS